MLDQEKETLFQEFWAAYPPRSGGNPKSLARNNFFRLINSREEGEALIRNLEFFSKVKKDSHGTRYIPHASTWLGSRARHYEEDWEGIYREAVQKGGSGVLSLAAKLMR